MKHPFAGKVLFLYLTLWVAIMAIHSVLLYLNYGFSPLISAVDAVAQHSLTLGLGLSYWYIVQYVSPPSQRTASLIFIHTVSIFVSASLVAYASRVVLTGLFHDDLAYVTFVDWIFPWRAVISGFALTLIVIIYYLLKYNHKMEEKEKQELRLQDMLKHAELEMLKFQINPHFIFNSLNSISSLTLTDPDKAREMVINLSAFLRSSLTTSDTNTHALRQELERMDLYLEIEKVRFGDRLKVNRDIAKECQQMRVPNMILQPLYENAIKYGIYEQLEDLQIVTKGRCENGFLKISVSNNYDSEAVVQKGKGIGLKNISNRLELIYGVSGLMTIEKSRTEFTVHLLIPQPQDNDNSSNH